ncbi:hypothetical protein SAMN05421823_10356 [Catalinimonas alkaloidigena]|uniref:Uncharacterized protein n=1 Tax=Catalinimonas alkaloidigena TaxID=1075417 RepID=A0A1G9DAK1_9BACT|nr:hypothetical protein [Catalinimonas alkaloidigena]SDK60946.1 hypothetical protein SAMN05421823_10356 [Catalinimonas alkaloidigena]
MEQKRKPSLLSPESILYAPRTKSYMDSSSSFYTRPFARILSLFLLGATVLVFVVASTYQLDGVNFLQFGLMLIPGTLYMLFRSFWLRT